MQVNRITPCTSNIIDFNGKKNESKLTKKDIALLENNSDLLSAMAKVGLIKKADLIAATSTIAMQKALIGMNDQKTAKNTLLCSLNNPIIHRTKWFTPSGIMYYLTTPDIETNVSALSKYFAPKAELKLLEQIAGNEKIKENFEKKYNAFKTPNTKDMPISPFGLEIVYDRIDELKEQLAREMEIR